MKLTRILPVLGAIALTLSFVSTLPVSAQSSAPTTQKMRSGGRGLNQLNLSDTQKQQIQAIHKSMRDRSQAVFTDAQKAEMQTAREQKRRPTLNLTDDQKAQLKAIREDEMKQIQALLTPEQRQKMQELKQQRQNQRQQRQNQRQNQPSTTP